MIAHRVELTDEAETEDNHTKRHQTTLDTDTDRGTAAGHFYWANNETK
jgi:hypothetical protein